MDCLFLPAGCPAELVADMPVYWLPASSQGRSLTLAECVELTRGALQALVVPVEACSAFAVHLPTLKARWLRQALPYAVEELLAEDVEQMHLALGEALEDGRHRVIALRRALLDGWVDQLQALGLNLGVIHVDADMLPRDGLQLLSFGERCLLGGAGEVRLALCPEGWRELASVCEVPRKVYVERSSTVPAGLESMDRVEDGHLLLAAGRGTAVDLAQGEFILRKSAAVSGLWVALLGVAVLAAMLHLGSALAKTWYLQGQSAHYASASSVLYHELFPEDRRIVNLKAQFDEHLTRRDANARSHFIDLMAQVANAGKAGVTLKQVDYSEMRKELALQVGAMDFAALEVFQQKLSELGLAVQLESASREEQGVIARLVLGV